MDVDFLSSDIHFPSDSNEPKLASTALHRPCIDPVDWALHDYHHTILEKEHVPLHALTDLRRLVPLQEKRSNETLVGTPPPSLKQHKAFKLKTEDVIFVVACDPTQTKSHELIEPGLQKDLRAALRGALDRVSADLEAKDRLQPTKPDPSQSWSWKEEVLQAQLLRGTSMMPQPSAQYSEERSEQDNSEEYEDETSTAVPSVAEPCPSRTKTSLLHKVRHLLSKPFHKPSSAPNDNNNNKGASAHPNNGAGFRRILLKRRQT